MQIKEILEKLRSLPESQKKIILFSIVAVLFVALIFLWFKITVSRIAKIEDDIKNGKVIPMDIPKIDLLESQITDDSQSPNNKEINTAEELNTP